MTEQEIERCLGRFTIGKATDVMNFDYSGTLAYLQRLKAENDELKEAEHRAEVAERALREFAVQISCRNCPFLKRCDTVPDAMDDYQGCFDMYLKQSEKDLAEEKK